MIEGVVNPSREAMIPLTLVGPAGRTLDIDAVIDTGFTGFLTLPASLISELELPFAGIGRAVLADGSGIRFPSYRVAMLWEGGTRNGRAHAAETTPLAGMALLDDHDLHIEVAIGGRVVVEAR